MGCGARRDSVGTAFRTGAAGRQRPAQRGNTLIVTMIVVVVLTLIATAAIQRSWVEVESAGMRRRYASDVTCIQAARDMVISQLVVSGAKFNTFEINRQVGGLTLRTGHYDQSGPGQVKLETSFNCGAGGGGGTGGGGTGISGAVATAVTNRIGGATGGGGGGGGGGSGGSSSCGIRIPVVCTDANGRALELEFLVKIGL